MCILYEELKLLLCLLDPFSFLKTDNCIQWTENTRKIWQCNWSLLTDQNRSSDVFSKAIQFHVLTWIQTVCGLNCHLQLKEVAPCLWAILLWLGSEKVRLDCSSRQGLLQTVGFFSSSWTPAWLTEKNPKIPALNVVRTILLFWTKIITSCWS